MYDSVPVGEFKKREKHLWKSVTFSKIAKPATLLKLTLHHGLFHIFEIVQIVPNRATLHMIFVRSN